MPLNFPSNPVLNDTYILGDKKWIFDGKGWKLYSASFELVPQVYNHANGAFDAANAAINTADAAYGTANNAYDIGNWAWQQANTGTQLAQDAYDYANTLSLSSLTNSTYSIVLTETGNLSVSEPFVIEQTSGIPVSYIFEGGSLTLPQIDLKPGNAEIANTWINETGLESYNDTLAIAFTGAGFWQFKRDLTLTFPDNSIQNTAYRTIVWDTANAGFTKANSANFLAQAAFDSGNSTLIYTTSSYGHANAAYDEANSSSTHADAAYNKANSANVLAQASFDFANTRYSADGGTIDGDVIITGNLNIIGNVISHSADDFIVNDPIVLLANNNAGNVIDIGFVAHYEDGGANTKHTGLVRDVSSNTWYLFEGYEPHIQENNILNVADPTLVISTLKANIDSESVIVRGQDVLERTNAAFDKANTDVTSISTTAGVYGNNTIVPVITLEANGRISSITNVSISGIGGGTATLTWIKKTADYTANVGDRVIADTNGGSFILTLPATPDLGDSVTIADGDNWYTNNLTVARNGSTIEGMTEDLILDIEGVQVEFVYDGTTWEVYSFSGPSPFPSPTGNTGRLLTTDGNLTSWSVITETYINASFGHANSAYNAANSISGIVAATPNTLVQRDSFGDIYANNLYANNLVSTSDIRFKNDIQNIDNPIDILNKLNAVSFKWINTDTKSYGLIAQELEKVLPELVSTTNDVKSVMYIPIIAILIEAIKQQQKEIDEIRNGKT